VSATAQLTTELQHQVRLLEDDMRVRVEQQADVLAAWQAEHKEAIARERTAAAWSTWRDDRVTQAAVAWVLTTVFIRFCEDNLLIHPVWISGPPERRQEAIDAQLAYFRQHPEQTDREWIEQAIDHLVALPATRGLVDDHAALRLVTPSGDAASALLAFWRERTDDGQGLRRDLADDELSTRFLGDLYQDISPSARDTYALLQTPVFVEEFILDRTLTPALADRPLDGFRLIDPTCGSGHFLLGAFARLLDRWQREAPGIERQALVQQALDAVHGVDLNPFAVAIARFRLTVAALQASGVHALDDAPAFRIHLATGDSLLHGVGQQTLSGDADVHEFGYETEDLVALSEILRPDRYDVVVGNPPYITVKDKALNAEYRRRYKDVCRGKYQLTAPFMKRFFELAARGGDAQNAGWVGQITGNGFMKREFGSPLIENLLAVQDLRLVVDASGAYIPGHGTPTVVIVGRNQRPVRSTVRAVLGIRGEPGSPDDPANGTVWRSIVDHVDEPGHDDGWTSTVDLDRALLAAHPWSLAGGGAVELRQVVEAAPERLGGRVFRIGFFGVLGADDAMISVQNVVSRMDNEARAYRALIEGDMVRDWLVGDGSPAWFPYTENHELIPLEVFPESGRRLWPYRSDLGNRRTFSGATYFAERRPWYEWHQLPKDKNASSFAIAFAFVATHNHFVLDRGRMVFSRSAPVIKMAETATEDDHLAVLGVLNSSTACFWLMQNSHNKGEGGGARVDAGFAARGTENWRDTYEFTGTTLEDFPLPSTLPLDHGRHLDSLAQRLARNAPDAVIASDRPSRTTLDKAHAEHDRIRSGMIVQQEELDWSVYRLYGLTDGDLTYAGHDLPELSLGERAFEIALARRVKSDEEATAWFERHGSTPLTEIPAHWPVAYRELVQRRLDLIAEDRNIRLLERPEYKRRWASESWEKQEQTALRGWLLNRLEDRQFWFDPQRRPQPRSVSQLADDVSRDADLVSVLALWEGRPDVSVTDSLVRLLADEAVAFLAAYRYRPSGLDKRKDWERTWELQRREDEGEKLAHPIAVPPKYASSDFVKAAYWRHRGKLDVPKERFILYPAAGRETDRTPVLGWAGWDHAQQSLALSTLLGWRELDGWPDERLVPLVAGLAELQPWVEQWHAEVDPTFGVSLAAFCRQQLAERAQQVGMTLNELATWRPATVSRRGRKPRTGAGA
jgi:hypothetical protein